MNEDKFNELIKELINKKVKYKSYNGLMTDTPLIQREGHVILEQILREFLLSNRDEQRGILEGKIFAYEQIISNSNFEPLLIPAKNDRKETT